jgi:hypothetical protein
MSTEEEPSGTNSLGRTETPHAMRFPIILVHGTWGRGFFAKSQDEGSREDCPGTRWFEKDSRFCQQFEEQLKRESFNYSIRSFFWSGANSVFARDRAAAKLAKELKRDLKNPSAAPVIIAHSHGGNVTLRALNYLEGASRIRIVTLATPFLRVFARESSQLSFPALMLVWAAITGVILIPMLVIMFGAESFFGIKPGNRLMFWFAIGGFVLAALGSMFVVSWLTGIFVNPRSKTGRSSRAYDIQHAAFYRAVDGSGPRMLVIRGVDDEASLTLAAGSIGSRLSSLFLLVVMPALAILVMLLSPLSDWIGANFLSKERADFLNFLALLVLDGCALGALALLFLPGMCKSAFGREFLTTAFMCEIATDSVPDTSSRIDTVTLSPVRATASKHLRHYIYDHSECVNEIVRWVRRTE